jgi:serine/threonine protein phosphatase PrpC
VGDSRAYWLDHEEASQLTVDDSLVAEAVAGGLLTPEQAAHSPFAHSITHWVGRDAPKRPPRVVMHRPARTGRLVLCTDGLWNYAPTITEFRQPIDALPADASPAAVAHALTDRALSLGARDNITVAVVDVGVR